jgi:gamma-glutamyltranspeptidase/glutathione hydrolase
VRIFTSVFQAVVNLIDHGMTLQEAVEAPRIWSQGQELEMEQDIPAAIREAVAARSHRVVAVPAVAGGMNAVAFDPNRLLRVWVIATTVPSASAVVTCVVWAEPAATPGAAA